MLRLAVSSKEWPPSSAGSHQCRAVRSAAFSDVSCPSSSCRSGQRRLPLHEPQWTASSVSRTWYGSVRFIRRRPAGERLIADIRLSRPPAKNGPRVVLVMLANSLPAKRGFAMPNPYTRRECAPLPFAPLCSSAPIEGDKNVCLPQRQCIAQMAGSIAASGDHRLMAGSVRLRARQEADLRRVGSGLPRADLSEREPGNHAPRDSWFGPRYSGTKSSVLGYEQRGMPGLVSYPIG